MDSLFKQVIVVRKDLNMRKGKLAAQVAHASNYYITGLLSKFREEIPQDLMKIEDIDKIPDYFKKQYDTYFRDLDYWMKESIHTKIVVGCDSEDELLRLIETGLNIGIPVNSVFDAGLTEFHGQRTLTCAAFGPAESELIDSVTKHLKLL